MKTYLSDIVDNVRVGARAAGIELEIVRIEPLAVPLDMAMDTRMSNINLVHCVTLDETDNEVEASLYIFFSVDEDKAAVGRVDPAAEMDEIIRCIRHMRATY